MGDLFGALTHQGDQSVAVLNNHTIDSAVTNAFFVYDDSTEKNVVGSQPSFGPGNLHDFAGKKSGQQWRLTMVDNVPSHTGTNVALYVGVTGIWNIFTKLGLPMLALVFLALSGHLTPAYIVAAVVGLAFLGAAVVLFALLFRSETFAIRIGNALARVVSWFRRLLRKPRVTGWGEGAARFRRDTITLVRYRWIRLTLFTVLSQLALFFVLLLSLRHMGVSEHEVSSAEAFAVFAFSRLLSAVPITPGGVGLIDLGYIGGLTAFDSLEKAQIVAAVLLFRALTYGIQIPIGGFTYVIWRVKSDWRRPADVAAQRERVSYFPA